MVDAEVVGAGTATPAKRPDLMVRLASAIVMIAVLAAAVWNGDPWLNWFIAAIGLACFVEFVLLVVKATQNVAFRVAGLLAGATYIGVAAMVLAGLDLLPFTAAVGAVIATDTFAYMFGRSIGGPKIAPKISPAKTWAGLFGGMIGAALWLCLLVVIYAYTAGNDTIADIWNEAGYNITLAAAIGAGLAIAAQAGDFFQSWLKRKAGVKDSSKLIPGHGGVFDRVDGLLPVALIVGALANMAAT